jgi:glycerol-3-phosphate acyltransferase PlsY
MVEATLLAIGSYLLGSVPFGFLVGKAKGVDLRRVGSGNIGSTNIYRALGLPTALAVFALDAGKGLVATRLMPALRPEGIEPAHLGFICGIAVMVGSVASVFMRLRGGKGVATGAGVFLGLAPLAAAICIAVWAALVTAFRYVSLGSLVAAAVLPLLLVAFDPSGYSRSPVFYLALAVALTVVVSHRSNITRLIRGKEHKVGRAAGPGGAQRKERA